MGSEAARPSATPALEPNAETWLDFTDLVFLDPAGTGYSRILGGDARFYYLGAYGSAGGRWKGEIVNQEHTPAAGGSSLFAGYDVGIGFSGSCSESGAAFEATALAGKRSLRLKAELSLLHKA